MPRQSALITALTIVSLPFLCAPAAGAEPVPGAEPAAAKPAAAEPTAAAKPASGTEPAAATPPRPAASPAVERRLAKLKNRIMTADYGADIDGLARLRDEAVTLGGDPALGYLARYWAGFAAWRMAINGTSRSMPPEDLKANLERAASEFEASIRLRDDFPESLSACGQTHGWLGSLLKDDSEKMQQHYAQASTFLKRAFELGPDNPRVLWIKGLWVFMTPDASGGGQERAAEVYRHMAEVAGPVDPHSPLPDWGKPEAMMSLAYTHLKGANPDLAAAREEAEAALRLQPDWSYVKNVLLPQIDAAQAKAPPAGGEGG